MKRGMESLEETIDPKRIKTEDVEEYEGEIDEEHTLIIQQDDLQEMTIGDDGTQMTIVHTEDGTQMALAGDVVEQEMTVVQDGMTVLTTAIDGTEEYEAATAGHIEGTLSIDTEQGNIIVMQQEEQIESIDEQTGEHITAIDEAGHITTIDGEHLAGHLATIDGHDVVENITGVEQVTMDTAEDIEGMLQYQNIIIQHMDIEEPLTTLRKLLESRLQCSLADHEFYLQDSLPLEPSKNLVSQCVQGSGMVQINVEVKSQPGVRPRLNIVDILKPAEEVEPVAAAAPEPAPVNQHAPKVVIPFPEEAENVTRWIVDQNFRKEQERLKIPFDPMLWNETHVRHWIQWAVKEFALDGVDIDSFAINGRELCDLKHESFRQLIPFDRGDIFWTHLELLRKCKFVAVIQQPTPHAITTITVSTSDSNLIAGRAPKTFSRQQRPRTIMLPSDRASPGNRTGNNGQIQLWQFLLELLTDKDCQEVIHWVGEEGEFKLSNPEMVAQLWGQRKNKPTMNYEKLSRALRYYYDGDMIAKVHGKRFVYKFVCDLQMLLGYTAAELSRLVRECADRKLQKVRESLRPGIIKRVIETK